MKFDLYQVDAFTNKLFGGNPAAVVPLKEWLPDELMQTLGLENNLSETVFFVPAAAGSDYDFDIRWFTPDIEINLCGHATLASSFILFNRLGFDKPQLKFNSKSGILTIIKEGDKYRMDFPSWKPTDKGEAPADLLKALGVDSAKAYFRYRDVLIELENEAAVRNCEPDFTMIRKLGEKVIITAPGSDCDFVSRFFAPEAGVNEDPVTGSAHSQLIPYWSEKLGKTELHAKQLSHRGGELWCTQDGDRVTMAGQCVFYMKGEFEI
ncbi:MAG: PhzF family phenazine biosynthesis protein [Flavitalea sp.]